MTRIDTSQLGMAVEATKSASSGSGNLMGELMKLQGKINENPQLRAQVRTILESNNLDPGAFGIEAEPEAIDAETSAGDPAGPSTRITTDQFLDLIRDFEANVGGEISISQVRSYGEAQPDQIQTLLDEYLNSADIEDDEDDEDQV